MIDYKISIVGGTDGFGYWLADYIIKNFSRENIAITITGRDQQKGEKAFQELGCTFSTDNISAVKDADIVIFSVPINKTEKVIQDLGGYIKNDAVVVDVTSIKEKPFEAMKKNVSEGVLIVPIHSMFGPYITDVTGQVIVLTPDEEVKKDNRYVFLKDFLEIRGAKIIETTPKEHDQMMSVVQGLTHMSLFALGKTLKNLKFDIEKSQNFVSPVYKILTSLVSRYMNQNPSLYSDIQFNNEEVKKVNKEFLNSLDRLSSLVENGHEQIFIEELNEIKSFFGEENSQKGQNYTDKIVYLQSKQLEEINSGIGEYRSFENIYTQERTGGKIQKLENDKVYFDTGEQLDINSWIIL